MNKLYETIHRYDLLDCETLTKLYCIEKKTDKQISEIFGCSKAVVWRKRKEYNIANRFPNKTNVNAKTNRLFELDETSIRMLETGFSIQKIATYLGCSLIVAKRRLKEAGLSKTQNHSEKFAFYDIEPSYLQKQMLIGCSLGDGHITSSNAFTSVHSTKQEVYFQHKMIILSDLHTGKFYNTKGIDPQGKPTTGLSFTTGTNKWIAHLRDVFYPIDNKVFPYDFLMENIDPIALAYWYMDDGSIHYNGPTAALHTQGFSREDHDAIRQLFYIKFGLDARLHKRNNGCGVNTCLTTESTLKFFDLIRPHVLPMFQYKIDYEAYTKKRQKANSS